MIYNFNFQYVSCRAGFYYYTGHVPIDVRQYYASPRQSFSLKAKSYAGAVRAALSVTQRLGDIRPGLRFGGPVYLIGLRRGRLPRADSSLLLIIHLFNN